MLIAPAFPPGKAAVQHREAMERLLKSETFAGAPRLRAVLQYLLQAMDNGTTDEITEQSIGQAVFGKPPGYNASEDNIVRVTVRHLRTRLDEFYRTEGCDEPAILVIPKGKYLPVFCLRDPKPEQEAKSVPRAHPSGELPTAVGDVFTMEQTSSARSFQYWMVLFAGVTLLTLVSLCYMLWRNQQGVIARPGGLLADRCSKGSRVAVVMVDANLQMYRSVFGKQVPLKDYINHKYGSVQQEASDARVTSAMRVATDSNDTNISSAIVAAAIQQAMDGRHIVIKAPHDVTMREFQDKEDVILLGGPWVNPWGQLFERRLNFRLVPPPQEPSASQIHNNRPEAG